MAQSQRCQPRNEMSESGLFGKTSSVHKCSSPQLCGEIDGSICHGSSDKPQGQIEDDLASFFLNPLWDSGILPTRIGACFMELYEDMVETAVDTASSVQMIVVSATSQASYEDQDPLEVNEELAVSPACLRKNDEHWEASSPIRPCIGQCSAQTLLSYILDVLPGGSSQMCLSQLPLTVLFQNDESELRYRSPVTNPDVVASALRTNRCLKIILAAEVAAFAVACIGSPVWSLPAGLLYKLGASWGPAIAAGELYRLVAPLFLHANVQHCALNVFAQWRIGQQVVEKNAIGTPLRLLVIYFGSGIFGNLVSAATDPYKLAVGSSTAGMGLVGAFLAILLRDYDRLPVNTRLARLFLAGIIAISATSGTHTDTWGHAAGYFGGFMLSVVMMRCNDSADDYHDWQRAFAFGSLALVASHSVATLACLPEEGNFIVPFPEFKPSSLQLQIGL